MILILCDEEDVSALWVAGQLRDRGLSSTVLTGIDLAAVRGWRHRIGGAGAEITLRFEGTVLHGCAVRGVLNRLSFLPRAWLARVGGPDRDYAMQEMTAFYLSWLHALPGPKLNPPTPQGLCGNLRHPSAWASLASRAGLPVRPYRQTSSDDPAAAWQTVRDAATRTVLVIGPELVGPPMLVGLHGGACLRLATMSGCPLVGVDFAPDGDGTWRMVAASVAPDLIQGGEPVIAALAKALSA